MICKSSRYSYFFCAWLIFFSGVAWTTSEVEEKNEIVENKIEVPEITEQISSENTDRINRPIKDWNFIVYIAANNNLHRFSVANIRQMIQAGSSDNINILVQLDGLGQKEVSRLYIEKDNPITISTQGHSTATTSGTALSLYEFIKWSITNYPAKNQAIVLWNHGSGIKDPSIWGRAMLYNRDALYSINYETGLLELNRNIIRERAFKKSGLAVWTKKHFKDKGIAFNDTFETYLTNQDLTNVLDNVSRELLGGKKIDLLCMDACHMAMAEIGSQVKSSVHYMVASEEIEPGSGYDYRRILEPFQKYTMYAKDFATHVVVSYKQAYQNENADYTQSAASLEDFVLLENNISNVGQVLSQLIENKESSKTSKMIKEIRMNKMHTTSFCDPDYIDLGHFYVSLSNKGTDLATYGGLSYKEHELVEKLLGLVKDGYNLLSKCVIANASGVNLLSAHGLSIYFPTHTIHKSYLKTIFDKTTNWSTFLQNYLKISRKTS
jgi:hypothetical protein